MPTANSIEGHPEVHTPPRTYLTKTTQLSKDDLKVCYRMAAMLMLGKACFLLFLLLTHLVLFGVPALQRFLEAGVTVGE